MAEVHPEDNTREKEWRTTENGSMCSGRGIQDSGLPGNQEWRGLQEAGTIWGRMTTGRRYPEDQKEGLGGIVGGQESHESDR